MIDYEINILLGSVAEINDVYSYIKSYIHHLYPITHSLPDHTELIRTEEHLKEVKHLR